MYVKKISFDKVILNLDLHAESHLYKKQLY